MSAVATALPIADTMIALPIADVDLDDTLVAGLSAPLEP
jgi:hypothetical protein